MTSPPTTKIDIEDLLISHIVEGVGDPLVLLHGWGANASLVWPLAERLKNLGYSLYVPDLPGFGESQMPLQAWTVHDYVQWVLAYLDKLGLDKVYLFGHSFGGRLGLVLGADHAHRIEKMVLANSAGVRPRTPFASRTRLAAYKALRNGLHRVGAQNLADNLRTRYNARYGSSDFLQSGGVMRETFVQVVNEDLLPYASRVACSTLLIWGDQDADTPLWQGQLLEKTIPDAGLVVYPGAGHYSYLDRLGEASRVIDYFFRHDD